MQRSKKGDVRAILTFQGANDARTIAFLGKNIRIYYPKAMTYQDVSVGNSGALVNQFLLLGFGSSGTELAQSYTINAQGSEKIGSDSTTKLRLTPKDAKVAEKVTQIEIWIPDDGANPIQQKFYEPSGNYRVVTYSAIKLNPPMDKVLDFKLPKGAQKQ
jgi:outer membrane lipoprotein-sorting protein